MIKMFNCFQLVTLFSFAPYLINWVGKQTFDGSTFLFYASCCVYAIMFVFMIAVTHEGTPN